MIILDNNNFQSRELFDSALDNDTITMLIFGDGEEEHNYAELADKATLLSSHWEAVWIKDLNILTSDEREQYLIEDFSNIVICVLNLDDRPVIHLTREDVNSLVELFTTFADAAQD